MDGLVELHDIKGHMGHTDGERGTNSGIPVTSGERVTGYEIPVTSGKRVPSTSRERGTGFEIPVTSGERVPSTSGERGTGYETPVTSGAKVKGYEIPVTSGERVKGYEIPSMSGGKGTSYEIPSKFRERGTDYAIPATSNVDENEYTRISPIVNSSTEKSTPAIINDKGDVLNIMIEIAAFKKKVYIFCAVLLTMLVIVSVTLGVLTHSLVSKKLQNIHVL